MRRDQGDSMKSMIGFDKSKDVNGLFKEYGKNWLLLRMKIGKIRFNLRYAPLSSFTL